MPWMAIGLAALGVFVLNECIRNWRGIQTNRHLLIFYLVHFLTIAALAASVAGLFVRAISL